MNIGHNGYFYACTKYGFLCIRKKNSSTDIQQVSQVRQSIHQEKSLRVLLPFVIVTSDTKAEASSPADIWSIAATEEKKYISYFRIRAEFWGNDSSGNEFLTCTFPHKGWVGNSGSIIVAKRFKSDVSQMQDSWQTEEEVIHILQEDQSTHITQVLISHDHLATHIICESDIMKTLPQS